MFLLRWKFLYGQMARQRSHTTFEEVQVWVRLTHTDSLAMAFVVAERA